MKAGNSSMNRILRYVALHGIHIIKALIISFFSISVFFAICFSFLHPRRTPLMVKRHFQFKEQQKEMAIQYQWVPLKKISPHMWQAVIAAEDNRFMTHFGIDLGAIKKAQEFNKKSTRRKRGASTISQQTAKNVFLWPARTYLRKGFEVYFTVLIETFWSKKRIMEMYLNVIEMGPGVYGVEAASRKYFNKPAYKLTRGQAAMIAITLPNPLKRNPAAPSAYMYRRQEEILSLMWKLGKIDL